MGPSRTSNFDPAPVSSRSPPRHLLLRLDHHHLLSRTSVDGLSEGRAVFGAVKEGQKSAQSRSVQYKVPKSEVKRVRVRRSERRHDVGPSTSSSPPSLLPLPLSKPHQELHRPTSDHPSRQLSAVEDEREGERDGTNDVVQNLIAILRRSPTKLLHPDPFVFAFPVCGFDLIGSDAATERRTCKMERQKQKRRRTDRSSSKYSSGKIPLPSPTSQTTSQNRDRKAEERRGGWDGPKKSNDAQTSLNHLLNHSQTSLLRDYG